jgi:predicted DNA-binding ribbon-helix-helix protein
MPKRPKGPLGKSLVDVKRSVKVGQRKSSMTLEDAFWTALEEIAAAQGTTIDQLIATIDSERQHPSLSSATRLFVLDYYRLASSDPRARQRRAAHDVSG